MNKLTDKQIKALESRCIKIIEEKLNNRIKDDIDKFLKEKYNTSLKDIQSQSKHNRQIIDELEEKLDKLKDDDLTYTELWVKRIQIKYPDFNNGFGTLYYLSDDEKLEEACKNAVNLPSFNDISCDILIRNTPEITANELINSIVKLYTEEI